MAVIVAPAYAMLSLVRMAHKHRRPVAWVLTLPVLIWVVPRLSFVMSEQFGIKWLPLFGIALACSGFVAVFVLVGGSEAIKQQQGEHQRQQLLARAAVDAVQARRPSTQSPRSGPEGEASCKNLGDLLFERRRGGRVAAFALFALSSCLILPMLAAVGANTSNGVMISFFALSAIFILAGIRALFTGLWVHEEGIRRVGFLGTSRWRFDEVGEAVVWEFEVNGEHSTVFRFKAFGQKQRLALMGTSRSPNADVLIGKMNAVTIPYGVEL